MTKEYVYQGETFEVSKPDNCAMKVTKDGCSAFISVEKNKYRIVVEGGPSGSSRTEKSALNTACLWILDKVKSYGQKLVTG